MALSQDNTCTRKKLARKKFRKRHRLVSNKIARYGLGIVSLCALALSPYFYNSEFDDTDIRIRSLSAPTDDCNKDNKLLAVGYIALLVYLFVGLAIVCDHYFEPVLGIISDKLNLSEDVAGATFMAAGSSAPELFTALLDAFGPSNSIGVGTIVGSAMFNVLIIIALSAAVTPGAVKLDWRPIARDVTFYLISIGLFVIFVVVGPTFCVQADGSYLSEDDDDQNVTGSLEEVCTYGSVGMVSGGIMVGAYFLYILFMVYNRSIMAKCAPKGSAQIHDINEVGENDEETQKEGGDDEDEDDDDDFEPFKVPDGAFDKFTWVLCLPFYIAFFVTVPNCEKESFKNWYIIGFIMCIGWLAVLCHFMVMFASLMGCVLDIDPVIMGVTILAAGTSVPDAIASMIVAKSGKADMAIANAVGSNVFDILLGLGFPWFLVEATLGKMTYVNRTGIDIYVLILAGTVALYVLSIIFNKFYMNRTLGYFYLILYVGYVVFVLNYDP